jgi:hypothetical protein
VPYAVGCALVVAIRVTEIDALPKVASAVDWGTLYAGEE